jgi:pimeloyl-ACP methyl ester carboxylesterase
MMFSLLRILAIIFAVLITLAILLQDFMIFFPQPVSSFSKKNILPEFKAFEYRSQIDDVELAGWLISRESKTLLIYFGGNGEEVSHNLPDFVQNFNCDILLMNYRGYGDSEGKPSEKSFFRDADHLYDQTIKKLAPEKIILMGRSLGSSVASYLAQSRGCNGLIMITPFDSIQSVASSMFPFLPVSLILKHKFRSDLYVQNQTCKTLVIIAEDDEIISRKHADALISSFPIPPTIALINGAGHNNIQEFAGYWEPLRLFLENP